MANKTRQSHFVTQITASGGGPARIYSITIPKNVVVFSVNMLSNFPVGSATSFGERTVSGVFVTITSITGGGTQANNAPNRPISPECFIQFQPNGTDNTTLTVQLGLILED